MSGGDVIFPREPRADLTPQKKIGIGTMETHAPKQLDIEELPDAVSPVQLSLRPLPTDEPRVEPQLNQSVPDATGYSD